jgi:hypothetical protein
MRRNEGLHFVGLEEVNEALRDGAAIARIEPGEAIMEKSAEHEDCVRLVFGGCNFTLVLDEVSSMAASQSG